MAKVPRHKLFARNKLSAPTVPRDIYVICVQQQDHTIQYVWSGLKPWPQPNRVFPSRSKSILSPFLPPFSAIFPFPEFLLLPLHRPSLIPFPFQHQTYKTRYVAANSKEMLTVYIFRCIGKYLPIWAQGKFCTLMLHPPKNRPRDFPTHTVRPPNILSTVTIFYCNTLTMWPFSTVTFRLCDNFLLRHFDHVTFSYCDIPTLTIFYCDTSTMWHFSTVTFRLCDTFLLWPSVSKWTDCPSNPKTGCFVTLWHSDPV